MERTLLQMERTLLHVHRIAQLQPDDRSVSAVSILLFVSTPTSSHSLISSSFVMRPQQVRCEASRIVLCNVDLVLVVLFP
jgi:hypothetical protein